MSEGGCHVSMTFSMVPFANRLTGDEGVDVHAGQYSKRKASLEPEYFVAPLGAKTVPLDISAAWVVAVETMDGVDVENVGMSSVSLTEPRLYDGPSETYPVTKASPAVSVATPNPSLRFVPPQLVSAISDPVVLSLNKKASVVVDPVT